jgi:dTDP-4-dehydrorhamnose reductase
MQSDLTTLKILITGANGLVGQPLVSYLLATTPHHIIATNRGACRLPFETNERWQYVSLDLTDGVAVNDFVLASKPDVIIHAAAMTQPDPCEENPIACWLINVTATRFLLDAAAIIAARFIFLSTDFVFDGLDGPYRETDCTGPVNYYGSSKLAAEKAVEERGINWAIIRTVLVYGNILVGNRSNVISWVKDNLENGRPIKVVSDQSRTPTYVDDLVKGIALVLEKNASGIYHISGADEMSPYDMAVATADYLQLDKTLMTQVNASTFTQPAQRPLKTGFIIEKARKDLGYEPIGFKDSLQKMLG